MGWVNIYTQFCLWNCGGRKAPSAKITSNYAAMNGSLNYKEDNPSPKLSSLFDRLDHSLYQTVGWQRGLFRELIIR
jgi:hypothetical protein